MAACVKVVQLADGLQVLALDPLASDLSVCPYVVSSGAELANSLFSLTATDGALISTMIVGTWAAAWAIRSVINVVKQGSSE